MISVTTNSKAPHSMLSRVPGGWRYRSARWIAAAAVVALPGAGAAQPLFDDVTSRLQSADSSVRLDALRALREAGYPEAAAPVAALLTDPVERVRLEAIETELSFFVLRSRLDADPTPCGPGAGVVGSAEWRATGL